MAMDSAVVQAPHAPVDEEELRRRRSTHCIYYLASPLTCKKVEYTENNLKEYIHEDDDTLPVKLGDGTIGCDGRFMLGTDKRATITTNWSWFRHHMNIQQGDICAFHFKRKEGRRLSLTVHRL